MRLFIDSDVIVSSLLSDKGASSTLLHLPNLDLIVSSLSVTEIKSVSQRLSINAGLVDNVIKNYLDVIQIKSDIAEIRGKYKSYVSDKNDTHIVAGAVEAKVEYLISYNLKDYNMQKIKEDFDIHMMTPGMFLQYLRSK